MSSLQNSSVLKNVYPKYTKYEGWKKGVKNVCNITPIRITMKEKNKTPWIGRSFSWIYFTFSTDFISNNKNKILLTAECVGFNKNTVQKFQCIMF